jgi:hypothetical protein
MKIASPIIIYLVKLNNDGYDMFVCVLLVSTITLCTSTVIQRVHNAVPSGRTVAQVAYMLTADNTISVVRKQEQGTPAWRPLPVLRDCLSVDSTFIILHKLVRRILILVLPSEATL